MSDTPPEVPIQTSRKSLWERASIVWLVPLAALAIALGVAWQSYSNQGPLIEILFENASGIHADETELRYRDVTVGVVEEVGFSEALEKVRVSVRLSKAVAEYVDADAAFWVVQPEVSARGVSGLDTVLSGVYIEGFWDGEPGGLVYRFDGQEQAPLQQVGQTGLLIELRSSAGTALSAASPIVFRGIEVGRLGKARLSEDGTTAIAPAVIYAPHDKLITTATRFWDTSGFTFSLGANGAELDFSSIASLISGGVTFETVVSGGESVTPGTVFEVFESEASARSSVFNVSDGQKLDITVVFEDNVAGLSTGAPVELGGVRIGEVVNLTGLIDEERFGDNRVRLLTTLSILPSRLGLQGAAGVDDALAFLSDRVSDGLRARLTTASILTGGLKIELIDVGEPGEAEMGLAAVPFPRMPSAPGEISDAAATAEGVFQRINDLPIEELMTSAIGFLDNASILISDGELRRIPGEVARLIGDARGLVGSDEVQAVPGQIGAVLTDLQAASADLAALTAQLENQDAVTRLLEAVDAAGAAAATANTAMAGLPPLITRLESLGAKVESLALESFVEDASALVREATVLISNDSLAAVPEALAGALEEIDTAVASYNAEGGTARLLAAVDAATVAAGEVDTAFEGMPGLIEELDLLAAEIRNLPMEGLIAEATELADAGTQLLGSDSMQALPGALSEALVELDAALAEFNAGQGATRLLQAVDAAATAAGDVSASVAGVPDLVDKIDAVAESARDLPLQELVRNLDTLVTSANAVVATEGAQALPATLNDALAEVEAVLSDLRQGGTVENVNRTLASAEQAAGAIAQASLDLPAIVDRVSAVLNQANSTLSSLDDNSELNREARAALRELARAADAIQSLARTIERRPNSIILGR
ncbi:PqiB family protein [Oceanibium sediminis]|uniref:PqiB family protein n=1 Tax=Oceanibium sediminis TaxID=2026339 RepID=UPI000DD4E18F|nr:MlaD family protein [Oceanibium sediminis]